VVQELYTYTWNQNNTFSFRAFPGNYTIEVKRYYWKDDHWELEEKVFTGSILLKDNSVVQVGEKHEPAKPIDLNKYLNFTILVPGVQMTSKNDLTFNVSVVIRLSRDENVTENLRDAEISLKAFPRMGCSNATAYPKEQLIEMIKPGQTVVITFEVKVENISNSGAVVDLDATLVSATGSRTGLKYSSVQRKIAISICKLLKMNLTSVQPLHTYPGPNTCISNCGTECNNYCATYNCTVIWAPCIPTDLTNWQCVCIYASQTGMIPRCGIP